MYNHEICRFINSKDIKEYLLNTNYNFTTVEASWLVYQCRDATLQEKIEAWKNIISTMPDMPVASPCFNKPYNSIHKVLSDYIEMKNKMVQMFTEESPKAFYQYMISCRFYDNKFDDFMAYSSLLECINQMKCELNEYNENEIISISIRRIEIDGFYPIEARYSNNAEIMDIKISSDYGVFDWESMDFFNNLWFHFPVPFKKGDIIYNPFSSGKGLCKGPVVMTGITPLKYDEDGQTHSDISDMIVWGYFQDEDKGTIYNEVTWNYMDFEYFPSEELIGKRRILKALSNYFKGEIDIDLLLRAYHIIILEETKNDIMPDGWWTEEGLELSGILPH